MSKPCRPHRGRRSDMRAFLDVSSGHLSPATWSWLDAQTTDEALRDPDSILATELFGGRTRYGWFVYAHDHPISAVPDDLAAVMRLARNLGCEYVLFDSDAPPTPELPLRHPGFQGDPIGRRVATLRDRYPNSRCSMHTQSQTRPRRVFVYQEQYMADYLTQFSCLFDVGPAKNAARADEIRGEIAAELDRHENCDIGFELEVDHESGPGTLWIHSDEYGEPEHVIRFVLTCAAEFGLTGRWGFVWALTCSKPRLDGFGGRAQLLDLGAGKTLAWMDCEHWLCAVREPSTDPEQGMCSPDLAPTAVPTRPA